jgi:hypothetical protein
MLEANSNREPPEMTHRKILASAALGAGLLALAHGSADAAIQCDGNFQIVNGYPISTPYCREANLAHVAGSYGWRISLREIRDSESKKAELCRAIGYDNRVQEVCAPYQPYGGNNRFHR